MSKNLPKYSKLLIVSDTGMYRQQGKVYAFGPVVQELEYFLQVFDAVTWIGFERPDQIDSKAYKEITSNRVKVIALKRVGGKGLVSKLKVLYQYPVMFKIILKEINRNKFIHCRAPSQPAFISMLLAFFYKKKQFWFKYAGSWVDDTSFSYDFQRKILKKLPFHSKVTVNGSWDNQKSSVITFENPCLSHKDRDFGTQICKGKTLQQPANYCFVGNLDSNKGADLLLEVLKNYSRKNLGSVHIVGDGPLGSELKKYKEITDFKLIFHGFLSKEALIKIYKDCHFIILPSKSEGFPKVIAEAMNYGCIPIVTDVSCIGQYVKDKTNGFLLKKANRESLQNSLSEVLVLKDIDYQIMKEGNYKLAEKFTYEHYLNQIFKSVFVKN